MKTGKYLLLLLLAITQAVFSFGQQDSSKRQQPLIDTLRKDSSRLIPDTLNRKLQVAIFTPLYLDSAFDITDSYRYGKTFPRFINPGLEFYEGVQFAIDSLKKENASVDFRIYDTRSAKIPVQTLLQDSVFNSIDLMIGHVSVYETRLLADAAGKKNIPFINANFPNDAGVTNNPNYVLLNSTLFSHIQGLYKFLQRNYSLSPITIFSKYHGPLEDLLKEYIATIERSTASVPLKITYVTLQPPFTSKDLLKYLDSNTTNICVVGSLDTQFGLNMCEELGTISASYACTIFGMPTWDVLDFTKPAFKNLEIFYSTPFHIPPTNKTLIELTNHYRNKFYSKPSDMVFRGFETVYHFTNLLLTYKRNLRFALTDKRYRVFTDFDIQPVMDPKTNTTAYLENKKIYFIKKIDGIIKAVY
ncbi:MAG TPA: hypothetical protein VM012_06765 [Flavitalea sp.]|nr:hypothetical protein [Flavitalea sp.]